MELHQLKYFVAVADHKNFTRAAESCFVSQPSLSQQIIKLEKEIGQKLIDRTGRSVKLTTTGEMIYSEATKILDMIDNLLIRATDTTAISEGSISIGAIPTVAPYFLPDILANFQSKFPKANISFNENKTSDILQECVTGQIDCGFVALPIKCPDVDVIPLFSEKLLAVLPMGHHLSGQDQVSIDSLTNEPFVLLHEGHCLGEQIADLCQSACEIPIIRCKSAQLRTVQELVSIGLGVSLIPEMAITTDNDPQRVYRAISGEPPRRTLALVLHKKRHLRQLTTRFVEFVKAHVEEAKLTIDESAVSSHK